MENIIPDLSEITAASSVGRRLRDAAEEHRRANAERNDVQAGTVLGMPAGSTGHRHAVLTGKGSAICQSG